MGLPSIIDVAEEYGVELNHRTLNHKEVLGKCPFCGSRKDKLSLNQQDNVFRCWRSSCDKKGGVLVFESLLLSQEKGMAYNKAYALVKEKHFGKKRKTPIHKAEYLTPEQLSQIEWDKAKRESWKYFRTHADDVILDWEEHCHSQKRLAFAKLLVADATMTFNSVIENIRQQEEQSHVPNLVQQVLEKFSNTSWTEPAWAFEGFKIAISAMEISKKNPNEKTGENALLYVPFLAMAMDKAKPNTSNQKFVKQRRQSLSMTV